MAHFFCIAEGMADFSPNSQNYHTAENAEEFAAIVQKACEEFDKACEGESHRYAFRVPGEGVNNYSQRVRSARHYDTVLDIIGMTADEYEREAGSED